MKIILSILICVMACAFTVAPACAETGLKLIRNQDSWKAYSFLDNGRKVCFMSAQPQKQQVKLKARGEMFFFVTHWPEEKSRNVISVSNGYTFKEGSQVTVTVADKNFTLFTQGDMAWTKDQTTDNAIVAAIQKANSFTITGTPKQGAQTKDTYSLKGSSAAYQTISKECAVK